MTLAAISGAARACALSVMGGFHPDVGEGIGKTVVMLGPDSGFWPVFTASPEYRDGVADPLDRWSARVIGALATGLDAHAVFPFGGPPFQPFIGWAQRTGRAWQSPVGLLVHDTAGLMVSYRGALVFERHIALPATGKNPCDGCAAPCRKACPVGALGPAGYDVSACKSHITTTGVDCMNNGCAVRRACPVSQTYARDPAQSAFHMRAFA
ncbi:ferredoxin [Octadecabacter sp. R77987]|uniref:ferredoxin n=1 Tax=Octadecabacter sp. R77987 TaxID=3093874 RepID=UPI003670C018